MTTIEKVLVRMTHYPQLSHRATDDSITVDAASPTGFTVLLHAKNGKFTVGFDGWHEHFDSESDALDCFAMGLAGKCRLKVCRRGTIEYRWTLEYPSIDGWLEDSTTGLLFFPFWRRCEVIYRQNPVINPSGYPGGH
ncbi:MAG: hypothetical protein HY290_07165 [Planctomycetia bacterium]|nr:hypothetical protein [Planctomycetia bacterium]